MNGKNRNNKCPCGSGLKIKQCHGFRTEFICLSVFLSDKNKLYLLKIISEELRKKTMDFLLIRFGDKESNAAYYLNMNKNIYGDQKENNPFPCELYNILIQLVVNNASDKLNNSSTEETIKKAKEFLFFEYNQMSIKQKQYYFYLFPIFNMQIGWWYPVNLFCDIMSRDARLVDLLTLELPNIKQKFFDKFKFDINKYNDALYSLFILSVCKENGFSELDINKMFKRDFSEIMIKILNILTKNVNCFSDKEVFSNHFFIKDEQQYICINCLAFMNYIGTALFWTIRDIYKEQKKGSTKAIDVMGQTVFPCYIEEVFKNNDITYRSLDENKKMNKQDEKRADYIFETNCYFFIIEVKSTYAAYSVKNSFEDLKKYDSFSKKIREGLNQLYETEKKESNNIHNKEIIKMIVTKESIPLSQIFVQELMESCDDLKEIKDKNKYIISNIASFENLIFLYKKDESKFNYIVEDVILKDAKKPKYNFMLSYDISHIHDKVFSNLDVDNVLKKNGEFFHFEYTMKDDYFTRLIKRVELERIAIPLKNH